MPYNKLLINLDCSVFAVKCQSYALLYHWVNTEGLGLIFYAKDFTLSWYGSPRPAGAKNSTRGWEWLRMKQWKRKQRLNDGKFSCTAKNSRTTWVRGCRGTSWKTWGRKTVAAQIQLNTKCMVRQNTVARIESRKTAGSLQLIYNIM